MISGGETCDKVCKISRIWWQRRMQGVCMMHTVQRPQELRHDGMSEEADMEGNRLCSDMSTSYIPLSAYTRTLKI